MIRCCPYAARTQAADPTVHDTFFVELYAPREACLKKVTKKILMHTRLVLFKIKGVVKTPRGDRQVG